MGSTQLFKLTFALVFSLLSLGEALLASSAQGAGNFVCPAAQLEFLANHGKKGALTPSEILPGTEVLVEGRGYFEVIDFDPSTSRLTTDIGSSRTTFTLPPTARVAEKGTPAAKWLLKEDAEGRFTPEKVALFFGVNALLIKAGLRDSGTPIENAKLNVAELEHYRLLLNRIDEEQGVKGTPENFKEFQTFLMKVARSYAAPGSDLGPKTSQRVSALLRAIEESTGEDLIRTRALRCYTKNYKENWPMAAHFSNHLLRMQGPKAKGDDPWKHFVGTPARYVQDYYLPIMYQKGIEALGLGRKESKHRFIGGTYVKKADYDSAAPADKVLSKRILALKAQVIQGASTEAAALADKIVASHSKVLDRVPIDDVDVIVPVPSSGKKHENAALELAQAVGRHYHAKLPVIQALASRAEQSQHTQKTLSERLENNAGAFYVSAWVEKVPYIPGKSVLLVDDVETTGVTLNDAVRALYDAGARQVRVYVAARTGRSSPSDSGSDPSN